MLPIDRADKIPYNHKLMLSERNNYMCQDPSSLGFRLSLGPCEKELSQYLSDFPPWVIL